MPFQPDLKKICEVLEKTKCRVHNKKPNAKVVSGKIQITPCCDKFQKECEKIIDDETLKQIDAALGF